MMALRVFGVIGLTGTVAFADNLDAAAQQRIFATTFEVVQLKPPEGAVPYERALPTDLIPYQQRVDKYRSIGTAFAIGQYVTPGRVLPSGRTASSAAGAARYRRHGLRNRQGPAHGGPTVH